MVGSTSTGLSDEGNILIGLSVAIPAQSRISQVALFGALSLTLLLFSVLLPCVGDSKIISLNNNNSLTARRFKHSRPHFQ